MKKIVVIGSGISGMTCACAMENKGYDVKVLEKNNNLGGYCQSFSRKYYKFAAAVHRIGGIQGMKSVNGILTAMGVKQLPDWYTFNESVQVGYVNFKMCNARVTDNLKELFPKDIEDIVSFENKVDKISRLLDG